jgi:hypothetical protein
MLALLLVIPAYVIATTWMDRQAEIRAWSITGPACPQVGALDPTVAGRKPAKAFVYRSVRFERQAGHASCVVLDEGGPFSRRLYPVCQFNAPAGLTVTTAQGSLRFQPGAGRNVTVQVRDGRPTCFMAGWFEF